MTNKIIKTIQIIRDAILVPLLPLAVFVIPTTTKGAPMGDAQKMIVILFGAIAFLLLLDLIFAIIKKAFWFQKTINGLTLIPMFIITGFGIGGGNIAVIVIGSLFMLLSIVMLIGVKKQ